MRAAKTFARKLFRSVGLDVRRWQHANTEETAIKSVLHAVRPSTVLDVGANVGQFAETIRSLGYRGKIVSFEAVPTVHSQLQQRASRDSSWIVAPCVAVGRHKGQMEINIAGNSVSSSLLAMCEAHRDAAPESAYISKQTVNVERLDELAAGLLDASGSVFLKIDTQGYEREVLDGATGILSRITALGLELSLVRLYENAPSLVEMLTLVDGLGYEMFNMSPSFRNARSGRLLQVDGFFVRRQAGAGGGV